MDWFSLTLIALCFAGVQKFLYKVAAERKCNSAWTTFSFTATVTIIGIFLFIVSGEAIPSVKLLLILGILNAAAYFFVIISNIEALKHIDSTVAYPIMRLNTILVVIFSVLYFNDTITSRQWIGVIMAVAVIGMLASERKTEHPDKKFRVGIAFSILGMVMAALATISAKFASMHLEINSFIVTSYFFCMIFAFLLRNHLQTKRESKNHKEALKLGFLIGLVNFGTFYLILQAYSRGPLSLIAAVYSLSLIIAITLSALIYKEELNKKKLLGIFLALVAIALIRF